MSLRSLLTQTATVIHRATGAGADAEGNPSPGTATSTDYPARLEQFESAEVVAGELLSVSSLRVFLPPTAAVVADDELTVDGNRYQVIATPTVHRTPRGPHHIEARLQSVA